MLAQAKWRLVDVRACMEDLETKVAELQRQSKATEGETGGKKKEKVGSDAVVTKPQTLNT